MSNAYFSAATFRFLRRLQANNNREWFKAHQSEYERHVREPFRQLIADLAEPLADISPHFVADTRKVGGSLFRPQRDMRYVRHKPPYKPFAGARFFHERRRETAAPSFYLHLGPDECFAGGGLWRPDTGTLRQLREFIVDNPAAWKHATRGETFRQHLHLTGEHLARAPRGFDADHELIEDLKFKQLTAVAGFDEGLACSAELPDFAVTTFRRVAPLLDYLCAARDLAF